MKKTLKTNPPGHMPNDYEMHALPGYQFYPESDDIYNKSREEKNMDPEDISKVKKPDKEYNHPENTGKESDTDMSGRDLDVPGSELDDEQENIGTEDEENNYYSIGGDNHNNLDEDKDDLY